MADQKKKTITSGGGPATLELEPPGELAKVRPVEAGGTVAASKNAAPVLCCLPEGATNIALPVALQPTLIQQTDDQMLWAAIRNRTEATGFRHYHDFLNLLQSSLEESDLLHSVKAYEFLKISTQAFLLTGTTAQFRIVGELIQPKEGDYPFLLRSNTNDGDLVGLEEARLGRLEKAPQIELAKYLEIYLGQPILPYIDRIVHALSAANLTLSVNEVPNPRLEPCLTELIWSYWHEEGMLVQAMNAVSLRFQNKRLPRGGPDPLAEFHLDPLRPLSNLLWGYIQDEPFRLTVARRAYEYDQEYGLRLLGRAVPRMRSAESRSKFLEAFHRLLYQATVFFREASDTTVIADGFPLLSGLKEVHLLLAEGAHNQFGDLPWTARVEMMIMEWLLARPEIKEFLRGRPMVPYKEDWMGQVDSLRKLHNWGDTPVSHFRDLGVFGEQILLSIRYGDWMGVDDEDQAKSWARYWKPELQGYVHAYRAVTGVDLAQIDRMSPDLIAVPPALLLQRRLPHRMH